jgi:hypothetical protein
VCPSFGRLMFQPGWGTSAELTKLSARMSSSSPLDRTRTAYANDRGTFSTLIQASPLEYIRRPPRVGYERRASKQVDCEAQNVGVSFVSTAARRKRRA